MDHGPLPVSIKGVVVRDDRVLLLRNDRGEWELPGGRIGIGETPPECVVREIREETGWTVITGPILDTWVYYIQAAGKHVFIATYGCHPVGDTAPALSAEHEEIGLFRESEVATLPMPEGYRRSIAAWFELLRQGVSPESGG